jgi:oxygen-dependent protoporphyrinogen oxidase
MGTDLPDPLLCRVHHHHDCIPVPTVGHVERMGELLKVLREEPWEGRLEVVGAGVGGVSMGDCVRAGREVGKNWH